MKQISVALNIVQSEELASLKC